MPSYPSFARFSSAQIPEQTGTEFVRLPDGSLVMTGNRPAPSIGMLDRLRAAASRFIPSGLRGGGEPAVPWWIAQPAPQQEAASAAPAPIVISTNKVDPWAAVEREAAHEQAIADQLGDFSRRVMASPQLIEGKWFSR